MSARYAIWLGLLSFSLAACASLTEPGPGAPARQEEQTVAAQPPDQPPPPAPPPQPTANPAADSANQQIAASHILIAYKGAMRAAPTLTRSKDEAQALAKRVRAMAQKGADFGALAVKYSDDPTANQGKGSLGKFSRGQMVKPFADAAFALQPGGISEIVETPFGFHVIKRTE